MENLLAESVALAKSSIYTGSSTHYPQPVIRMKLSEQERRISGVVGAKRKINQQTLWYIKFVWITGLTVP